MAYSGRPGDEEDERPVLGARALERRRDACFIAANGQSRVIDVHHVEQRLDDAHAVLVGLRRFAIGLHALQADHHAQPELVLDGDRANRVDRVEQAGMLHQQQRSCPGKREPGADRHALVLLAYADQAQRRVARDRPQQAVAGDDVRQRDDRRDAAALDCRDDVRAADRIAAEWLHGASPDCSGTDSAPVRVRPRRF